MNDVIKRRIKGLEGSLELFSKKIADMDLAGEGAAGISGAVFQEMKALGYDEVMKDKAGNLIGIIKGHEDREDLVLISHMDPTVPGKESLVGFKAGIISSIYAGALLKRSMLPLKGDLVVCCVPRAECCGFGIKYLFGNYLKKRIGRVKGALLCEPTDLNVHLGHKGRMEYEIVVKGRMDHDFLENKGINMLGTMFPLINELEKVSHTLPSDCSLGASSLKIKDVSYNGCQPSEQNREFRIVVDRNFIPEEDIQAILKRAKSIARSVYKGETDIAVATSVSTSRFTTAAGLEVDSQKEFAPWRMEANHPLVGSALEVLTENGFKSELGYWQKIITEGSYIFGELKIPTVGFGVGREESVDSRSSSLTIAELEKAVYGQALIAQRVIGIPTFGWSADEI